MNRKQISMVLVSLGMSLGCATAIAQAPGSPGAGPSSARGSAPSGSEANAGGSGTFSGWLAESQRKNAGKVSRQAYMDEVGRRWDQADSDKQGLSVDQINRTYSLGATGAAGVNTAPGNMGPNNAKK